MVHVYHYNWYVLCFNIRLEWRLKDSIINPNRTFYNPYKHFVSFLSWQWKIGDVIFVFIGAEQRKNGKIEKRERENKRWHVALLLYREKNKNARFSTVFGTKNSDGDCTDK